VVSRGEVWWVEEPAAGRRPHLVLTRHRVVASLNAILAVPATTTIRDIPTEVPLGRADGMPRDCVLSLDNVTQMPRAFFAEPICRLSSERMREVCKALAIATGCDVR
jgi:mRNA interferase MazF